MNLDLDKKKFHMKPVVCCRAVVFLLFAIHVIESTEKERIGEGKKLYQVMSAMMLVTTGRKYYEQTIEIWCK